MKYKIADHYRNKNCFFFSFSHLDNRFWLLPEISNLIMFNCYRAEDGEMFQVFTEPLNALWTCSRCYCRRFFLILSINRYKPVTYIFANFHCLVHANFTPRLCSHPCNPREGKHELFNCVLSRAMKNANKLQDGGWPLLEQVENFLN